jgi:hypothetical protein
VHLCNLLVEWANDVLTGLKKSSVKFQCSESYYLRMKLFGNGMRLMTTEGDIGWAHPLALPNDGVFLLRGCSIPVILREVDDDRGQLDFQVIGDAYVHGIMHGELWQQASELLPKVYLH